MIKFILLLILILAITYFATTNSFPIQIALGTTFFEIPLSLALISPVGISLFLFTLFYLFKTRRLKLIISDLENQLKEASENEIEINKRKHQLELENKKLKTKLGDKSVDEDSM